MTCCKDVQMDVVKGLIYRLEKAFSLTSKDTLNLFLYNYPRRFSYDNSEVLRYLGILRKIEYSLLNDVEDCFECCYFQKLHDRVNSMLSNITYRCQENVLIDDSGKTAWELAHPYCISRSRWEELAYRICDDLSYKITVTEKRCDLTFELSTETFSCNTIAALSVYSKMCELEAKLNKTEHQCLLEFELIKENHPDCDLTFNMYKRLTECNLSFDIINQILCDSEIRIKNNQPVIQGALGEYIIDKDLTFRTIITPEQCSGTLCRAGGCDVDSGAFIKALMNDYNLTKEQKQNLLKYIK